MAKRKGIGKKLRFEVFKRDSFKCQYCGRVSPDVILEIDHIKPVKEGGTNDISNLITSCNDCNIGKGARLLSDDAVIKKQRKQLEELNERREQLEMMMEWRESLKSIEEDQLIVVDEYLNKETGSALSDYGKKIYRKLIKKYGIKCVLDAIDDAVLQYLEIVDGEPDKNSVTKVYDMVPKICYCKIVQDEKLYFKDLLYIRGILRNRIYCKDHEALKLLEAAHLEGYSINNLREFAKTVKNWTEFQREMYECINGS